MLLQLGVAYVNNLGAFYVLRFFTAYFISVTVCRSPLYLLSGPNANTNVKAMLVALSRICGK